MSPRVPPVSPAAAVVLRWELLRDHFKAERARRRLSQKKIAQRAGIDQSTVSKLENDPTYQPLIETFTRAIHGLGIQPSEFFAAIEALHSSGAGGKTSAADHHGAGFVAIDVPAALVPHAAPHVQGIIRETIERLQGLLVSGGRRRARAHPHETPRRR
jgi:transcriptional regulator with XRE-family HTH domain